MKLTVSKTDVSVEGEAREIAEALPANRIGKAVDRAASPPRNAYKVDVTRGCWIWTGHRNSAGYGGVRYGGRSMVAHRAYFAHYVAPIPAGLVVMHLCDEPACVNPDHLALGTQRANRTDSLLKGRDGRGSRMPQTRLTDGDIERIYELRSRGLLQRQIADEVGVSRARVSDILTGRKTAATRRMEEASRP